MSKVMSNFALFDQDHSLNIVKWHKKGKLLLQKLSANNLEGGERHVQNSFFVTICAKAKGIQINS